MIFNVPTIAHCEICAVDHEFNVLQAEIKRCKTLYGCKRRGLEILRKFQMLENKYTV